MTLDSQQFGLLMDGRIATRYHLGVADGIEVQVTDYGATLLSLMVPDENGKRTNVILAYDSLEAYQQQTSYGGGIVGRFANRIRHGQFAIDGTGYQVTVNTPLHHLHGGKQGFDRQLWQVIDHTEQSLTLQYVSPDGEEGYPGTLTAQVTYSVIAPLTLQLEMTATTDAPTVVNLTAHPYFNLAGQGDILNHLLTIHADAFTPADETMIPTGEIQSVAGTPFDFRLPTPIGARIGADHPQLKVGNGYDHNFVVKVRAGKELVPMARLSDPSSGRTMEIHSTQPGIQVYSGNFLNDSPAGADGRRYFPRCAVALEPQAFPDAPNHPHFPSAVITPDHSYHEIITYTFGTESLG